MSVADLRDEVTEEVGAILAAAFKIEVTKTTTVPHSGDQYITFPNLDAMKQGAKLIETCVLYIDIRRSTELNFTHKQETVAKLYSAFVRAMTRCARYYGGHVRGIVGDRIMVIFDSDKCFEQAMDVAVAMNSVSKYVINKHFTQNEVTCGIGVDHGTMLATKTGFVRHGHEQQNYRNLVWLGRPANVASKLTDIANKSGEEIDAVELHVGYDPHKNNDRWVWRKEAVRGFLAGFEWNASVKGQKHWYHKDPDVAAFFALETKIQVRPSTPPILVTNGVYDGFTVARPNDSIVTNGWFKQVPVKVPGTKETIFGGDVIFQTFKG